MLKIKICKGRNFPASGKINFLNIPLTKQILVVIKKA